MAGTLNISDPNREMIYVFRFGSSDKVVNLNQYELDLIPYLSALVTHKDDFSSIENENGEYVLNNPIEYIWFIPILRSITCKNPYILFNEISEKDNVLDTLQLFDYLGIDSFSLPILKDENLIQSNPIDGEDKTNCVEYHKANLSETRQSAAEFIVALSKNEYNLSDLHTVDRVFSLVRVILGDASLFSSRFRHHTLTVIKECSYSFFSKKQQHLLPTIQQIHQHSQIDSIMYLYDDDKPLPDAFQNAFAWKGLHLPIQNLQIIPSTTNLENRSTHSPPSPQRTWDLHPEMYIEPFVYPTTYLGNLQYFLNDWTRLFQAVQFLSLPENFHEEELPIYRTKQDLKNNQAQSARSGHFNTLPKRPKVDKFKHRSGPKPRKYR